MSKVPEEFPNYRIGGWVPPTEKDANQPPTFDEFLTDEPVTEPGTEVIEDTQAPTDPPRPVAPEIGDKVENFLKAVLDTSGEDDREIEALLNKMAKDRERRGTIIDEGSWHDAVKDRLPEEGTVDQPSPQPLPQNVSPTAPLIRIADAQSREPTEQPCIDETLEATPNLLDPGKGLLAAIRLVIKQLKSPEQGDELVEGDDPAQAVITPPNPPAQEPQSAPEVIPAAQKKDWHPLPRQLIAGVLAEAIRVEGMTDGTMQPPS